jgi:hypothetical protein
MIARPAVILSEAKDPPVESGRGSFAVYAAQDDRR